MCIHDMPTLATSKDRPFGSLNRVALLPPARPFAPVCQPPLPPFFNSFLFFFYPPRRAFLRLNTAAHTNSQTHTHTHLCGHPAAAAARSPSAFLACDQSQRTAGLFRAHHRLSILFFPPICFAFVCFFTTFIDCAFAKHAFLIFIRPAFVFFFFSSFPIVVLPSARG